MMAMQVQSAPSIAANDDPMALPLADLHGFHRIGGDCAVMLPEAVVAWVRDAAAGDRRPYAFGHLPAWSKGPQMMRTLCARGFVHLTCKSAAAPKIYYAERTDKPWCDAEPAPRRVARVVSCYDTHLVELLALVGEWAAAAEPMPSNAQIAKLLGLRKGVQVAYLLGLLERGGQISRRPIEGWPFRVVTVVKAGVSTGTGGRA
jgi:hypothetical protein